MSANWKHAARVLGAYPARTLYALDGITSARLALSSARQMSGAYSGALVQVREDSGDTAADVGASGGVLDQTALLAHLGGASGYVARWYEQCGHADATDFVQVAAATQPRIAASGVVDVISGRPCIKQNETASLDWLEVESWTARPADAVLLMVARRTGTGNWTPIAAGGSGGVYVMYAASGQSSDVLTAGSGSGTTLHQNGALIATDRVETRAQLHTALSSALGVFVVRGLDFSNVAWANTRTSRPFGAPGFGFTEVQEIVVLESPTEDEISSLEANMAAFYGVTLA